MLIYGNNLHRNHILVFMEVIFMLKRMFLTAGVVGLIVCGVAFILTSKNKRDEMLSQERIANELIRFHVRANSDSDEDQELKLKVRDGVIAYLQPILESSVSVEDARGKIQNCEEQLIDVANAVVRENGYDYDVVAYFNNEHFPMKVYGDVALPAGEYEAFRIDIGAAKGHNWWCVLYPQLCFEDLTHAAMSEKSKELLKENLSEEDFLRITGGDNQVEVKFKIFTFLNKRGSCEGEGISNGKE